MLDVVLPEWVASLKDKRGVVKPVVAALRKLDVSAAEVGSADLWRRSEIGVGVVAGEAEQVRDVLDSCERLVAGRPELELLSAHRQLTSSDD